MSELFVYSMPVVLLMSRIVPGGVLVLAGISKSALGAARMGRIVESYRLLPDRWAELTARVLAPAEILLGAAVVLGFFSRVTSMLALLLLGVVTGAAISALVRGLKAPCGCFGDFKTLVTWRVAIRNSVLLALLVPGALVGGGAISLDGVPVVRPYLLLAAGLGLVAGLLVARARRRYQLLGEEVGV